MKKEACFSETMANM